MRILYYNCNSGISGDMNVAAMLDLGLPLEYLKGELAKLNINEYELKVSAKVKNGISGTQLKVICNGEACEGEDHDHSHSHHDHDHSHSHHSHSHSHHAHDHAHAHSHSHHDAHAHHHEHSHRNYADIKALILASSISERAKKISLNIFEKIAIAEAKVHSKSVDEVAFHEVGAVDSIVDIVASAIALDYFNVDKIYSTAVELGGGTLRCAHGTLPVPAPATALLMQGLPSSLNGASFECTTPTGAAIIASTVDDFNPKISAKILAIGVGVGHKDSLELTNILRISLMQTQEDNSSSLAIEDIVELSSNIDDMNAEDLSFLAEELLSAGALDVWQEPIYMKKGRLGQKVSMICHLGEELKLLDIFLKNSSTYGIRRELKSRYVLARKHLERETIFGKVCEKVSQNSLYTRSKVEFEDKKRIAKEQDLSIIDLSRDLDQGF